MLGAKPKDIDVFIDTRYFPDKLTRDSIADRLFTAFGQTCMCITELDPEAQEDYANLAAAVGAENFFVYQMVTTEREWEPLNIIFSPGNHNVNRFDWSVCEFYLTGTGIVSDPGVDDLNQVVYRDYANVVDPQLTIEHALRIKAKYPTARFVMTPMQVAGNPQLYQTFLEGGVFGEYTRPNVQTEGEVLDRDEIRQPVRAGLGDRVDPFVGLQRFNEHIQRQRDRERGTTSVEELVRQLEQERRARERERAVNAWATAQHPLNWDQPMHAWADEADTIATPPPPPAPQVIREFRDDRTQEWVRVVDFGNGQDAFEQRTPF